MPESNSMNGSPSFRRRKQEYTSQENDSNAQNTDNCSKYTEEQQRAVEKIRSCSDYYEILGVTKEAGESELRKQYKKLALQLHPDKNKAPGAVEAFKAVGNAFAVLTDPVKRKRYDTYGLEAMQTTENHTQEGYYYAHSFEGDMTAEELYNMFFQGQTFVRTGGQWRRFQTGQSHHYHEESQSPLRQMLPLLFVVGISILSTFLYTDPPYSLQRTMKYLYERRTSNLDVPYYVKDSFMQKYESLLSHVEKQVEDEYLVNLRTSCFRERNYKENMIWRAKHFKDVNLEAKAKSIRTPSCDALSDLYKNYNRF
ncbi:dnaJ homolog subfamily B member 1 isoform X2 [Parasteatoda tepidariorum]|uniref:dnaJ homolog subfamily B member 1 isoform X2 n=1 Tax=Parasteatoda tepidariorum TaxID=114398 RepID=UPI001C71904F|nr:dnaJ homolog subfamily B member 1 isoform X2 [Parasteatoda tepidariorum]